jgi:CO/xanthine dehydrogenase Mo-binding subunit
LKNNDISEPILKVDHQEKTAGNAAYLGDLKPAEMLFAKTLRSTKSRARIRTIDIPKLPEGYFIVDHHDVPGKNRVKIIIDDQPFFAEDDVKYIGEPILLVVGPEKPKIMELLGQIRVDYEEITPVLTMEDAENPAFQPIFENRNYFAEYTLCRGNVAESLSQAKYVFEDEYRTGYQEHIYLEPQGVLGVYEEGKITVYGSIQCPYYVKNALIQAFGWDGDRVRVVQTALGGAFGGKEDYPSLLSGQVAVAAYKTGRPVQLMLERGEDIEVTTKRHPSVIHIKTGLDQNYRIVALEADIRFNAGAYSGLSNVVLQRGMFNIAGVYHIPNLKAIGKALATNTVPNGAFRGFGAPQAIFAIETHMNALAHKLELDPLELKMRNIAKKGDLTSTGGTFRQDSILPELIEAVVMMADYHRKIKKLKQQDGGPYRGIGLSIFLHGCGFTGSGERDHIKAEVKLRRLADGQVEILVANTDMGQGLKTSLKKIVSTVLDLPVAMIIYENPDTDRVPDSGPTVASRTTMIVGKLVEEAAIKLKSLWNQTGEVEVVEKYKHPNDMQWDNDTFSGDAYPAYSWGVNAVEVDVDPVTYEMEVKGVWSAFDVGKAIDTRIMRGQIEGGILQGLGYGSMEVMECKQGRIQQRSVTDYIIPTAMDCAKMEHRLIDNPYDNGPFGAKGAGELTLLGAAPALAAAVSNALGIPIRELPITPEYLMEALQNAKKG